MESPAAESADRTELIGPVFRAAADADDFLPDDARVTVDTDLVDSVVVVSVSTGTVAA
jgi:hypothetical protein